MSDFHKQLTIPDIPDETARPIPMPPKIGPYKIESLFSKGGMSLLYFGIHPGSNLPIIVKVLLPKYLKHKEMVGRFLKEAQIIALTDHPNIVKLYGQGQWEKGLYIAMEFIRGISLRQFIQQKSLSQKRALEIILQVAYALCHLHTHGVIHRDLKPENILITESGEIKVIDFGIAQLQGEAGSERITQTRRVMGTPVYMSPEQKENPLHVTYASDIYSLGIIAYELLLGRLSHGVIHLALLPKMLSKIIDKALQTNPEDRYQDIVDFITDISQIIKIEADQGEETEEERTEEVLDLIQQTRSILIPKKGPHWPQIETGLAMGNGQVLSGLYIDFFHLPQDRFGIIVAEPNGTGVASLLHSSVLRGMVRMAIQGKKEQHPLQMLQALNHVLHEDPMKERFSFNFLLLTPDKDQLSFVSCKSGSLWHIAEESHKVRMLTTPNAALGADPNTGLLETVDNWYVGDTLIFYSGEESSSSWIAEHRMLAPQPQAEKILHHLSGKRRAPQRASTVISIRRMF